MLKPIFPFEPFLNIFSFYLQNGQERRFKIQPVFYRCTLFFRNFPLYLVDTPFPKTTFLRVKRKVHEKLEEKSGKNSRKIRLYLLQVLDFYILELLVYSASKEGQPLL